MNVLHLTLTFAPGGRRTAIAALARGLDALGVRSSLCCLETLGCERGGIPAGIGEVLVLGRNRLFDFDAIRRLREFCRRLSIDIVHAHDVASESTAVFGFPGGSPPILMTFHRSLPIESARWRHRARNALLGTRVRAIVTASEERRRHYLSVTRIAPTKVHCIPLGVDTRLFVPDPSRRLAVCAELNLPGGAMLIGAAGHFGPEKGMDIAIRAFQEFCRQHPGIDAHLLVFGTGPEAQATAIRSVVEPVFASRIHFLGYRDRMEAWFPALDVLVHAPRLEAFGLVLIEAMACGVPIAASAVGGIPEIIRDGETGYLAASGDVAGLATAIASIIESPERRGAMATASISRVRDTYSLERYAARHVDLYRAIGRRADPPADIGRDTRP